MSELGRTLDQIERVLRNAPREVERVARLVNSTGEAVRGVSRVLEPAVRLYQETHGGQSPRRVVYTEVPDATHGPLVELGSLAAVAYLTNKDEPRKRSRVIPDARPDLFIHDFERPYPTLAFRADSRELVIVRTASRYTIGREGIEG